MRGGRMMGTFETDAISEEEISRLMVGRDVMLDIEKSAPHPGRPVLEVRDLRYTNEWNKRMLDGVSFTVRAGEILGVAGVEGNGQRELVESLFGFRLPQEGSARVNGKDVLGAPQRRIRALGVSLVPEDRMTYGMRTRRAWR
jgi:simple sugar transport system ATP-binding protein